MGNLFVRPIKDLDSWSFHSRLGQVYGKCRPTRFAPSVSGPLDQLAPSKVKIHPLFGQVNTESSTGANQYPAGIARKGRRRFVDRDIDRPVAAQVQYPDRSGRRSAEVGPVVVVHPSRKDDHVRCCYSCRFLQLGTDGEEIGGVIPKSANKQAARISILKRFHGSFGGHLHDRILRYWGNAR